MEPRTWIAALRKSHARLVHLVEPMPPARLRAQSYCRDWTIAQVLSHIGSGAEIALVMLPGALGRSEPTGREAFAPVWERWNAMNPDDQAATALAADAEYVWMLEQLTEDELADIRLPFFGLTLDAAGMIRLRLAEHALHTWDIAVAVDPVAVVAPDAAALLIDNVPRFIAPRLGKPQQEPFQLRIRTSHPDRDYLFSAGETVSMTEWPVHAPAGALGPVEMSGLSDLADLAVSSAVTAVTVAPEVEMPAEALIRLAYGRLDPGHTPATVAATTSDLDRLRAVFPGF